MNNISTTPKDRPVYLLTRESPDDDGYVEMLLSTIFNMDLWADSVYDDIYCYSHQTEYNTSIEDKKTHCEFLLALINVYGDVTRKWAGNSRYAWAWEKGT